MKHKINWREKGDEEDRECGGRIALREIWKQIEENGIQQTAIVRNVGDG